MKGAVDVRLPPTAAQEQTFRDRRFANSGHLLMRWSNDRALTQGVFLQCPESSLTTAA
jgi:hypothetical protein